MELSDLKMVWKKTSERQIDIHRVDAEALRNSIRKKSNTVIAKVKRTMRFKIIMFLTLGILNLVLLPNYSDGDRLFLFELLSVQEIQILLTIFSLIIIGMGVHIWLSLRQISACQRPNDSLKASIENIIKILNRIINTAVYSDVMTAPMLFGWVTYVLLAGHTELSGIWYFLIVPAVSAVTAWLVYVKASAIQQRKFGNDRDTLRGYLQDLNNESE